MGALLCVCLYTIILGVDRAYGAQNRWVGGEAGPQGQLFSNFFSLFFQLFVNFFSTIFSTLFRLMRGNSYIYTLGLCNKDGVLEMIRVCQDFFCKTLAVSRDTVQKAFSNVGVAGNYVGKDKRKGRQAKNKLDEERKNLVKDHINSFPRIEPHYCRKDSNKQYLSPELNVTQMYRLYLEWCHENEVEPVKESMYRHIFVTDFNLQCFIPKKDQCSVCPLTFID